MAKFEVVVDPGEKLRSAMRDAAGKVENLTVPFKLIAQSWFQSNKAIFALKGPGKYVDLKAKYKEEKKKAVGFVYPILKRTGALMESLTNPTSTKSVNTILNGNVLLLGTKIPYGPPHQDGAPKINLPKRPFILLGPEQVAPPEINRRADAWVEMIRDYCYQVSLKAGVGSPGGN